MWLYNDSIYRNLEKNAVFVGDELEVSVFGWKMIGPVAVTLQSLQGWINP